MLDMFNPSHTQRWHNHSPRWRPADEGGFDPDHYEVVELPFPRVSDFVTAYHYSKTMPSTRFRWGLIDHSRDTEELVGIATLGMPMHNNALTNVFPNLVPSAESIEFNRLVLAHHVPANGESWFCARVFNSAADKGIRGIITFADPAERWCTTDGKLAKIKPGHVGIVYQALNFHYIGRTKARTRFYLPTGEEFNPRSRAKITSSESGHNGAIARLTALGAPPIQPGENPGLWVASALNTAGYIAHQHPGNHKYALSIGRTRGERTRTVISLAPRAYPKPGLELPLALPGLRSSR